MEIINVKELKNISINELTEIIEQENELVFELSEMNYTLILYDNISYNYFMFIKPNHSKKFFKDLKMVNDVNEVESYFKERFNDIIYYYHIFPATKTIKNLTIIVKHLIDIYHENFTTKKELLLQMI